MPRTAIRFIAAAGMLALACAAVRRPSLEKDPGWEGVRNRVAAEALIKRQDFGHVPPTGSAPGRIGGVVWRSIQPAYYGKVIGPFGFNDSLTCSGTVSLRTATATVGWQNGSTTFVGFFNHREQGWRPVNFIGFRLEGYNEPDGATVELSYGTSQWTAGGAFVNTAGGVQARQVTELDASQLLRVAPGGKPHTWSLDYEPGDDGDATLRLTFDGVESVVRVSKTHRDQGASFDRFGLFNAQMPGNSMELYLADVVINGFREDLTADPKWDTRGTRQVIRDRLQYGANDFGFLAAERAIGGRLWRVERSEPQFKGYYADRVGPLTLNDPLVASGRLRVPRFSVDSGAHFGWFNSREQGWPPRKFVGVYLDSLSSDGRFATPMYGTKDARLVKKDDRTRSMPGAAHGPARPLFRPDGTAYRWRLQYDPAAGDGRGAVSFKLGDETFTLDLAAGDKAEGAEFDRFGLFNMQDNNGKDCEIYLDELEYNAGRD